jgi:hemolysin D
MRVVPETAHVEVDTSLDNKEVGFVGAGQQANVKIDAFDYTKYGTVPGRVQFVSRDAVEGKDGALLYTVRVLLERSTIVVDGRTVTLSPGMAVNVDIKTGRRRILEYVLSPLLRHEHESLHER